jgi:hypothetical protein
MNPEMNRFRRRADATSSLARQDPWLRERAHEGAPAWKVDGPLTVAPADVGLADCRRNDLLDE